MRFEKSVHQAKRRGRTYGAAQTKTYRQTQNKSRGRAYR